MFPELYAKANKTLPKESSELGELVSIDRPALWIGGINAIRLLICYRAKRNTFSKVCFLLSEINVLEGVRNII